MISFSVLAVAPMPAKAETGLTSLDQFCRKTGERIIGAHDVDCDKLFSLSPSGTTAMKCAWPKITGVFLLSNITPGGTVLVQGCGFGSKEGGLRIALMDFKGNTIVRFLNILEWNDTYVGATIPSDIFHVKDQSGKLKILTAAPQKDSNEYSVSFQATQDLKLLPMTDVIVGCSSGADTDQCNGDEVSFSPPCPHWFAVGTGTANGQHFTCADPLGSDSGTDSYTAILANGWVTHSMDWSEQTSCDSDTEVSQVHPYNFAANNAVFVLFVDWITCLDDGLVTYDANVFIKGPIGVPHK
jgi:hypothetical protein